MIDFKKGAMDTFQVLIIVLLIVGLRSTGAFGGILGQTTEGKTPTQQLKIEGLPACVGVDKTTVTLSAFNEYDSTVAVGGPHQYKINGGRTATVADGGNFDAKPTDKLDILWANGNSTGTVVYLKEYEAVEVPCGGTQTYSKGLQRNGSITSRIFNQEGNEIDDSLENETLGAGDVVTLRHELEGTFERGQYKFGGCVITEYNNSLYDDVIVKYDEGNERISTPDWFTVRASEFQSRTYSIPSFTSNKKLAGSITFDVDNTNNPDGYGGGDVFLNYAPNEWRLNSKTNKYELFTCGENEDGNRVSDPIDGQLDTVQVD